MEEEKKRITGSDLDLILIAALIILEIVVVLLLPEVAALRIIIGFIFWLLAPGYSLIAALFPENGKFNLPERIVVGIVASLILTPFLMLGLNYTPLGIRLHSLLLVLSVFSLVCLFIAYHRRRKLPEEKRFHLSMIRGSVKWKGWKIPDWVMLVVLAIVLTAGVLTCMYFSRGLAGTSSGLTEFYVLDGQGESIETSPQLSTGQELSLTLGITSREDEPASFAVEVISEEMLLSRLDTVEIAPGQNLEIPVTIKTMSPGEHKVELILFKNDETEPFRKLHLWIDVTGS